MIAVRISLLACVFSCARHGWVNVKTSADRPELETAVAAMTDAFGCDWIEINGAQPRTLNPALVIEPDTGEIARFDAMNGRIEIQARFRGEIFQSIFMHEIGHVIGLDHHPGGVMNEVAVSQEPAIAAKQLRDLADEYDRNPCAWPP